VRSLASANIIYHRANLQRRQGLGQWALGTRVKESVAPVLASEPASSFLESTAWPGIHWSYTGGEEVGKTPEVFWLEKRWSREEKGKGRLGIG